MKIKLAISIFIVLCMVLSACQPTPESEPVVNKGGDWVTSMVEKSADYGRKDLTFCVPFQRIEYDCPEKLDYSLDSENISVKIDAQIVLPKYKIPIVLLEEKNMEYSQIAKLNKILGLDVKKLYHFDFAQMASTKKQIEKLIEQQLENIADLNKEGIDTKYATDHLEHLYRELDDAPENYSEAAKMLGLDNDDISKPFVVTEKNYSKQNYVLVAEENLYEMVRFNAMPGNGQYYIYLSDGRVGVPSSNSEEYIVKNYFSIDEGKKEIKPFLEALASELKLVEIGVMGDIDNKGDTRPYGYVFVYKRMLNGVDSNYAILPSEGWRGAAVAARIDIAFSEEVTYSSPPLNEELMVSVTEEGVLLFELYFAKAN